MRLRLLAAVVVAGIAVVVPAGAAGAHPLGNFTVNTYAGLSVETDRVAVDLVVDMAEIPAYQAHRGLDADGNGQVSDAEGSAWAAKTCGEVVGHSQVSVDGKPVRLSVGAAAVVFPPGTAGLPTLRLTCDVAAPTATGKGEHKVAWRSSAYTDRVGWREVTATGSGVSVLAADVPAVSPSARLTQYPADLLSSPLDQRSASVRVRADGGGIPASSAAAATVAGPRPKSVSSALPRGVDAASRSFTALVARRDLTFAFGALALALAVGLGAIHALAPGHGKTVMAAYLVGQRGSLRQAGIVALTVTTTHTIGVLVLGLVLSASTTLASEAIYPWLGLVSGAMLAAVGFNLMRRALRGRRGHGHSHSQDHDHSHEHSHGLGRPHSHGPVPDAADATDGPMSRRTLVAMGVAGGMVPSPSALVVLLGAIALKRAWFGVVLVIGYGVGMALTLTAAGLILVRARRVLDRRAAAATATSSRPSRLAGLARAMPVVTATVIVAVGLFLAAQGVTRI